MNRHFELYNPTKTYMYPSGKIATPEIIQSDFEAITTFPHMIETDPGEQVFMAIENLSVARARYNIDPALSDAEAVEAIEVIANTPEPVSEYEPSPEERMAAAMELQTLMMMEDMPV